MRPTIRPPAAPAAAGEDADSAAGGGEDLAAAGESGLGELGPDGAPLADPALAGAPGQGDPMSQAAPMAAMLPSMLAGVLGGALGAVASVPSQIGQQVQSVASQAGQAMEGLTKGLSEPDLGELDTSGFDGGSLGDVSGGGGGGAAAAAAVGTLNRPPGRCPPLVEECSRRAPLAARQPRSSERHPQQGSHPQPRPVWAAVCR